MEIEPCIVYIDVSVKVKFSHVSKQKYREREQQENLNINEREIAHKQAQLSRNHQHIGRILKVGPNTGQISSQM